MGFSQRRRFPGFGCFLCEKEIALNGLKITLRVGRDASLILPPQPHRPEAGISLTKSVDYISEQCFAAWQPCSTVEHVYSLDSRRAVGWNPEFTPSECVVRNHIIPKTYAYPAVISLITVGWAVSVLFLTSLAVSETSVFLFCVLMTVHLCKTSPSWLSLSVHCERQRHPHAETYFWGRTALVSDLSFFFFCFAYKPLLLYWLKLAVFPFRFSFLCFPEGNPHASCWFNTPALLQVTHTPSSPPGRWKMQRGSCGISEGSVMP